MGRGATGLHRWNQSLLAQVFRCRSRAVRVGIPILLGKGGKMLHGCIRWRAILAIRLVETLVQGSWIPRESVRRSTSSIRSEPAWKEFLAREYLIAPQAGIQAGANRIPASPPPPRR